MTPNVLSVVLLKAQIVYDKGTLLIRGDVRVPNSSWDARSNAYRAPALYYSDILAFLEKSNIHYEDYARSLLPVPRFAGKTQLRDYQNDALDAWVQAGNRGSIVLPTGAGKTLVAVGAVESLQTPTLVVVPTLELVAQWRRVLADEFNVEIGVYGGGENTLLPITVSTYDSAYLRAAELGNRFGLIVFDEVHHLPAEGYRYIAEMSLSPARMGLTATYEREDGLHSELSRLVGGKVFELSVQALAGDYLSDYEVERLYVDLAPDEQERYAAQYRIFTDYLARSKIPMRTPQDFSRLVMRSGRDGQARKALLARNRAMDIALNSRTKIEVLKNVLTENSTDQTIIFTQHNKLVRTIARSLLIPAITHVTPKDERREILDNFHDGTYRIVVTSKVLDEGVDVPDAAQAIILSGTGSSREFIQRLGRILRKREGKQARLVEIVTRNTSEMKMSTRRKRKWREGEHAS